VISARYRPFTRRAGKPDQHAHHRGDHRRHRDGGLDHPAVVDHQDRRGEGAPTPKKAPWPMETWPLKPVSRFRPMAAMARYSTWEKTWLVSAGLLNGRYEGDRGHHHAHHHP
jgi:hypothetical protein